MTNTSEVANRSRLRRGSEWRKWDLHVHSPHSGLNNQFPKLSDGTPDWEAYLAALEQLDDITALGITDYFTIEGYKQILQYRSEGRLPNFQLVLPNIEFRLDKIVASTKDGEDPRRLNAHVIFSDEVAADDIEEHFLRELKFSSIGNPAGPNEQWSCMPKQLAELGARLKQQHSKFRNRPDFEIGCTQAVVDLDHIKRILGARPSKFKGRYMIILAEQYTSLVPWDSQAHQSRKLLLQGCHAIFSSNPKTREWALGRHHPTPCKFIEEFCSLKPCLHGSDAHSLEQLGKPDGFRYCWIKADPTFEGLKQILFEPEERVFIGEAPPRLIRDHWMIDSVKIECADAWVDSTTIELNRGLIAIIGGRGSGKSALAELIAFAGGAKAFRGHDKQNDFFLDKASRRSDANPAPITGAKVTIQWADGRSSPATIPNPPRHTSNEETVKYLPQKFVESLCAPENTGEMEAEIERVIFQRIKSVDRMGASSFGELRELKTKGLRLRKEQAQRSIEDLTRSIADACLREQQLPHKSQEHTQREKELRSLIDSAPKPPEKDQSEIDELQRLMACRKLVEAQISGLTSQLSQIDALRARITLFERQINEFNAAVASDLTGIGLGEQIEPFLVAIRPGWQELLQLREGDLQLQVACLRGDSQEAKDDTDTPHRPRHNDDTTLAGLDARIEDLKRQSHLSETSRLEFEKFSADRHKLEDLLTALSTEIVDIEKSVIPARVESERARLDCYLDYFELLREEKNIFDSLYRPLREALSEGTDTDRRLDFVSNISADVQAYSRAGLDIIDRRRGQYRDEESFFARLTSMANAIQEDSFSREAIRSQVESFRASFTSDSDGRPIESATLLRKDKTVKDLDDWLFSTWHYTVSYSIKFDGKDLQLLSPGQKGIVLLLVYLEVDQEDDRPLLIDQPEDNLDNLSVYSNLINYFRRRKKLRQIVIITHNPNLVVNTDAEQIIVARFDGDDTPKISYRSGALEEVGKDGAEGIREGVCKILEGGTEAFQRRERKYAIEPVPSI